MTAVERRTGGALIPAGLGEVTLADAVRAVIPPEPGERYSVRNLTELWLAKLRSEHTRKNYARALRQWLDYCLRAGVDPLRARRADVDDWVEGLPTSNPGTLNGLIAGIASWYRYLLSNDLDIRDPAHYVERPKTDTTTGKTAYLSQDGLNALLREAARRARTETNPARIEIAARNLAVLLVLATTAVRSGAIKSAGIADVRREQAGRRVFRYVAKGGKDRYKPLVPTAAAAVDAYLRLRADRVGVPVDDLTGLAFATTPHFGTGGDGRLTDESMTAMLRSIARAAGIGNADELVPHSLRTTLATLLAGQGKPLAEVQDFLDHADVRTTRIYVHTDESLNKSLSYTAAALLDDDLLSVA